MRADYSLAEWFQIGEEQAAVRVSNAAAQTWLAPVYIGDAIATLGPGFVKGSAAPVVRARAVSKSSPAGIFPVETPVITDGSGGRLVAPLTKIVYDVNQAPTPAMPGSRQRAIDRAWALEAQLVQRTGRGSRPWTESEVAAIQGGASYRDLGFTGHHINRVQDLNDWKGDPRNIEFLRQGKGEEHMVVGHPGGTRAVQPPGTLIDRQAMLNSLSVLKGPG
jgi:hypothetical protein